jgi:hypothetical protein
MDRVSKARKNRQVTNRNVSGRPRIFTPQVFYRILGLVDQGLGAPEIADTIGCNLGSFRVRCSQQGISYLFEEIKPFAADLGFIVAETGDVAARMRQARYDALLDWVGDIHKHDRHGAGNLPDQRQISRGDGQNHFRHQAD